MQLKVGISLVMLCFLLGGCGKKEIVGSEKEISQIRNVASFSSVTLKGYYVTNITIGKIQSVAVKINANLFPYIDSSVKSKTLTIQTKKGYTLRPQGIPEVDIVVPSLKQLNLSGSNNVTLKAFSGDSLELNFSGSNQLVAQGVVNTLYMGLSGNTSIDALNLTANKVEMDSTGNAKISLDVKNTLKVAISGNGVVTYFGNPSITQTINGSGTVSKLQETISK